MVRLRALTDIAEYKRLNRTIEPEHKKGDIFSTNKDEALWLTDAKMAEEIEGGKSMAVTRVRSHPRRTRGGQVQVRTHPRRIRVRMVMTITMKKRR